MQANFEGPEPHQLLAICEVSQLKPAYNIAIPARSVYAVRIHTLFYGSTSDQSVVVARSCPGRLTPLGRAKAGLASISNGCRREASRIVVNTIIAKFSPR
jgi:hypothetical protein